MEDIDYLRTVASDHAQQRLHVIVSVKTAHMLYKLASASNMNSCEFCGRALEEHLRQNWDAIKLSATRELTKQISKINAMLPPEA